MNIQQMMKQAQQMQEQLQKQMAEMRVEATAGGGMVTVIVNGDKQVLSLKIDPEVVSKDDVEMLQDLILAAHQRRAAQGRRSAAAADGRHDGRAGDSRACPDGRDPIRSPSSSQQLQRLPGIGAKSAQRLAFHVLKTPREEVERLAEAMREVKDRVTYCSVCSNITDVDPCYFCTHPTRDHRIICVVEQPENVGAIEKTRDFKGVYHVLMGALSPLQGIGPDDLKIKGLLTRVGSGGVEEVILATNPNVEGEATALYLAKLLKPLGVRVTRIAMGVPVGSDLDYADEVHDAQGDGGEEGSVD